LELRGDLVPVEGARRPAGNQSHVAQPEGQQDGLFQPLVDDPGAVPLLRHARLAFVQKVERGLDGVTDGAAGGAADAVAGVPGGIDRLGKFGVRHEWKFLRSLNLLSAQGLVPPPPRPVNRRAAFATAARSPPAPAGPQPRI